ncbi:TauD/TfdA family dioxygenase [Reyranella sp. CPCC 100927]|uniref:TauD/TfdA dioxygenase family protein n=1 Tax=Reyranella sp. CPCC 100927 TaxID=2599616 RepID=UPI0011B45E70|nr:TauD/TfdA family dioxygenase [Reyranella sp. CPCC 100927]TWT01173.1 TauD/TfdA family dioxygenase [Reyranella sp. CPCC 100927]
MSYDRIEVRPLAGSLGAEIRGVDVRRMDNQTWSEVHQAFLEFRVIAIRDQQLQPDDIMSVSRRFGEPNFYPFVTGMEGYPYIFEIVKEPQETRNFGGGWHSDTTYLAQPPLATVLYALETPAKGGDTLYCNTAAAYDALSDTMKDMLGRLKGVNSAGLKHSGGRASHHKVIGGMKIQGTEQADTYEAIHPIVRTCPDTGRKALYVSRAHTIRFDGMTEDESRPLIEWLQQHQIRPEFTCRVQWEPGTLTVWDNRCTQHSAINDYNGQRRRMQRITVGPQIPA